MVEGGEDEGNGQRSMGKAPRLLTHPSIRQQIRPPCVGEAQREAGDAKPDKGDGKDDMLDNFIDRHSLIGWFGKVLLAALVDRVYEDDQVVNEHPAQHKYYQPNVDQSYPVVHHHLTASEDVGVARREIGVGILVTLAAGSNNVLFVDRGRRI